MTPAGVNAAARTGANCQRTISRPCHCSTSRLAGQTGKTGLTQLASLATFAGDLPGPKPVFEA
jgi:hypothetical protein